MNALVLEGYKQFRYRQVPDPVPGEGEVLVRVRACSVCGSDIHGCDGSSGRRVPPVIMGHEAAGVIEALGPGADPGWREGERVTFDSTGYCGACEYCLEGRWNLCRNRRVVGVSLPGYKKDGAMAELVSVPAASLYRIPDEVTFRQACLMEPLAVGLHAVELSPLKAGDTAVVIGDGTIGLMAMQMALARGASQAAVLGRHGYRLEMARQMGASAVFQSDPEAAREWVLERTGGCGAHVVLDAVGTDASVEQALSLVRDGGSVVLVGNTRPTVTLALQDCIMREITLIGSYNSAGEGTRCLELIREGRLRLQAFTKDCVPLAEGAEAFRRLLDREEGLLKVVLEP